MLTLKTRTELLQTKRRNHLHYDYLTFILWLEQGALVQWLSWGTLQLGLGFGKNLGKLPLNQTQMTGCTTWDNSNRFYFDIRAAPNIPAQAGTKIIHKRYQEQEWVKYGQSTK